MSSSWGNWAAQDCPRCARAAFVQRSFRNVLRSFYDELGAQTSRSAPFLPQELDSREDTSRNGEGARAADREGQLRDDGHADLGGLAFAEGRDVEDRRVSDQEAPSGRRHHAGEEQHGGVRVRSDGNGELAAARLHAQPVCPRSRHGRLERRDGRGGRRELRRRRPRHGHRQLHPRAVIAHQSGGHSFDDGTDQSRWHRSVVFEPRHRWPDGAECGRCSRRVRCDRRP